MILSLYCIAITKTNSFPKYLTGWILFPVQIFLVLSAILTRSIACSINLFLRYPKFIIIPRFCISMWNLFQLFKNFVQLPGSKLLFYIGEKLSFFKTNMLIEEVAENNQCLFICLIIQTKN